MIQPLAFLSYCHVDQTRAARLREDLINAGIDVWWDQDILPGSDWKYAIRQAIKRCDAVILCLSAECMKRAASGIYPEALDAIGILRERRPGEIFLIPVRFSQCDIPPLEIDGARTLDRLQYIDLFPVSRRTKSVQRIVEAVRQSAPGKRARGARPSAGHVARPQTKSRGVGRRSLSHVSGGRSGSVGNTAELIGPIVPPTAVNETLRLYENTSSVIKNSLRRYLEALEGLQRHQLELLSVRAKEAFLQWFLDGDEALMRQRLLGEIGKQTSLVGEIEEKIAETQRQRKSVEDAIMQETSHKIVVSVDMVGYSSVARMLEENQDASAVSRLNKQIRRFIDKGLSEVGIPSERAVIQTTGDGALLVFGTALNAHRFAEAVHASTVSWNRAKKEPSAKRWFRIGAASGPLSITPGDGEVRFAGVTIANAVRLETAARPGELVIDLAAYNVLPKQLQSFYGKEETVRGKRDEVFTVRRCDMSEGMAAEVAQAPVPVSKPAAGNHRKIQDLFDQLRPKEQVETLINLLDIPSGIRPSDRLPPDRRFDAVFQWARDKGQLAELESELGYLAERQNR